MTTLSRKPFECAFCGKVFQDDIAVGSNTSSAQDTDFRTHSKGVQAIPHYVHTCPFCGFTDDLHEEELQHEERERILEYLSTRSLGQGLGGLSSTQKYELLANLFIIRNRPSMEIAQVYMKAAWMAEDESNLELGNRFRECAKDFLVRALETHEVERETAPVITYLVGELNRRLGKFNEAAEWFSRVRSEDPRLAELCRRQEFLAFIQTSVNARIPKA
jgi:uncharacterized protein